MLRELRIRNFTIVEDLKVDFEPGLNILTGETGAGKSVIVDALGALLGDRISHEMIKTGGKEAHIEAYFDDTDHLLLKELSIGSDEGIILRRSITSQGKGRSYINDSSASIQTLAAVGRTLIDIHGQHEHQGLLKKENHLLFLDAYGGLRNDGDQSANAPLFTHYSSLFHQVSELRDRISAMKERVRERGQRIDFLRFQVAEIDAAQLKPGEKTELEEERSILLNLSKLKEASETAYMLLYEAEGSALEQLSSVVSRARDIAQIDQEAQELLAALDSAAPILDDAAMLLRKLKDKYDIDPQKLEELDERLELLKRLEKKYGDGIGAILEFGKRAAEELKALEHADEELEASGDALKTKEAELISLAEELSGKRHSLAKKMEALVMGELKELGFQKAEFRVEIKKKDPVAAHGMDDVEFLFSANPGEAPKPLAKVASGGELSRIMLALKCIKNSNKLKVTSNESPATLIFDEVDAGIGGVTAQHVGKRLKDISAGYQVLCITHLPQIAALADYHMKVEKTMEKNNVKVSIEPLSDRKREEELARMLSGRITDVSLKHAKELLGDGKDRRA
ncbi:MAG TPA: DNA repair protein RecN [Dissulfurispiraceae bacterium]